MTNHAKNRPDYFATLSPKHFNPYGRQAVIHTALFAEDFELARTMACASIQAKKTGHYQPAPTYRGADQSALTTDCLRKMRDIYIQLKNISREKVLVLADFEEGIDKGVNNFSFILDNWHYRGPMTLELLKAEPNLKLSRARFDGKLSERVLQAPAALDNWAEKSWRSRLIEKDEAPSIAGDRALDQLLRTIVAHARRWQQRANVNDHVVIRVSARELSEALPVLETLPGWIGMGARAGGYGMSKTLSAVGCIGVKQEPDYDAPQLVVELEAMIGHSGRRANHTLMKDWQKFAQVHGLPFADWGSECLADNRSPKSPPSDFAPMVADIENIYGLGPCPHPRDYSAWVSHCHNDSFACALCQQANLDHRPLAGDPSGALFEQAKRLAHLADTDLRTVLAQEGQ